MGLFSVFQAQERAGMLGGDDVFNEGTSETECEYHLPIDVTWAFRRLKSPVTRLFAQRIFKKITTK